LGNPSLSETVPLRVHGHRAVHGAAWFEVLSEDHAGGPLPIGGICDDAGAIAILIRAGVPNEAAAAAVEEAKRSGVARVCEGPALSPLPEKTTL
jgi:hypothetical protein